MRNDPSSFDVADGVYGSPVSLNATTAHPPSGRPSGANTRPAIFPADRSAIARSVFPDGTPVISNRATLTPPPCTLTESVYVPFGRPVKRNRPSVLMPMDQD